MPLRLSPQVVVSEVAMEVEALAVVQGARKLAVDSSSNISTTALHKDHRIVEPLTKNMTVHIRTSSTDRWFAVSRPADVADQAALVYPSNFSRRRAVAMTL